MESQKKRRENLDGNQPATFRGKGGILPLLRFSRRVGNYPMEGGKKQNEIGSRKRRREIKKTTPPNFSDCIDFDAVPRHGAETFASHSLMVVHSYAFSFYFICTVPPTSLLCPRLSDPFHGPMNPHHVLLSQNRKHTFTQPSSLGTRENTQIRVADRDAILLQMV